MASVASQLPVLSLPREDADENSHRAFAAELCRTCHDVGFFYLSNHGVEQACDNVLDASRALCALPLAEKKEIDYTRSRAFRGYMYDGAENTAGKPDRREQIEFGVECAETCATEGPYYERLKGPNQWPAQVPLRAPVEDFQNKMATLSRRIMTYLALGLDLDGGYFDSMFGDEPNVQMKICRYPPSDGSVGEHSDTGILSFVVQDSVGGLQVQLHDSGEWIDAPPIDGTLVVNLGEMIQLITGGYLLATPHRVQNLNGSQARYSVPYFWNPELDYRVEFIESSILDSLVWHRPRPSDDSFRATGSHGGANRLISAYGENAFKSFARSHPVVMRRHHSDLVMNPDGSITSPSSSIL